MVWPCWIHAPNYVCFGGKSAVDEFPISYYEEFLSYVRQKYEGALWHALSGEVSRFHTANLSPASRNTRKKIRMLVQCNSDI